MNHEHLRCLKCRATLYVSRTEYRDRIDDEIENELANVPCDRI